MPTPSGCRPPCRVRISFKGYSQGNGKVRAKLMIRVKERVSIRIFGFGVRVRVGVWVRCSMLSSILAHRLLREQHSKHSASSVHLNCRCKVVASSPQRLVLRALGTTAVQLQG